MSMDQMESIATNILQDQARGVARVTVSLGSRAARQAVGLPLQVLLEALSAGYRAVKHRTADQYKTGKISIQELQSRAVRDGGVKNIEVGTKQLGEVQRQLKQLGVDFSVTRGEDKRAHLHFIARDLDTIRHGIEQAKAVLGQTQARAQEQSEAASQLEMPSQSVSRVAQPEGGPQQKPSQTGPRKDAEGRVSFVPRDTDGPVKGKQLRDGLDKQVTARLAEPVKAPAAAPKLPAKGAR